MRFSLHLINLAARISAAVMAGDIIQNFLTSQYFLVCRIAYKGVMDGARGGEKYYISKPLWSSGKIYASGSPSLGLKRSSVERSIA